MDFFLKEKYLSIYLLNIYDILIVHCKVFKNFKAPQHILLTVLITVLLCKGYLLSAVYLIKVSQTKKNSNIKQMNFQINK